jgi:hypothetical protein
VKLSLPVAVVLFTFSLCALAQAAPPRPPDPRAGYRLQGKGAPVDAEDDDGRPERREEFGKRMRLYFVVGLAEALELSEAETLKLSERLKGFEDRRRPVQQSMGEAMKSLKAAAQGDAAAAAQVDANLALVFDGRAQLATLDREMFNALAQGQSPAKRARLALFFARAQAERAKMRHLAGEGGGRRRFRE